MRHKRSLFFLMRTIAISLLLALVVTFKSHAQLGTPPKIDVQPVGITVLEGGIAEFSVTVSLSTVLTAPTFKWRRNGQEIGSGLTVLPLNTLTLGNVRSGDAGTYTVVVRNASGSVTSAPANLVVQLDTVVSQVVTPLTQGMTTNGFRVLFSGPSGSNFVIQASSDLSNWSPISTNAAPDGTVDFTDTTALNRPQRFYRAFAR